MKKHNYSSARVATGSRLNTVDTPRIKEFLKLFREHVDADDGIAPVEYYYDEELFQLELERIFAKSWVFVGHTSEIPEKGDYIKRPIAQDDFILVRDESGSIRLLLNNCPHRGTEIVRAERGNTSHFRCPYHNWIFKNSGQRIGASFQSLAYRNLDNEDWSMLEVPHVETFYGLIFANLDGNAPPLREYLGDLAWYLETVFNLHEDGFEVVGSPQRFIIPTDWKSGAENFIGDNYHAPQLHRSVQEVGLADYKGHNKGSRIFVAGAGGGICAGTNLIKSAMQGEIAHYLNHMYQLDRLDKGQQQLHEETPVITGTVFPSFSFSRIGNAYHPNGAPRLPVFTLRKWQPLEPGKLEMWSFHIVYKALPEKYKEAFRKTVRVTFGSSGLIEQDDTMAWPGANRAGKSIFARKQGMNFNFQMSTKGMSDNEPLSDWPGPGVAYSNGLCEMGHRYFHDLWLQAMEEHEDHPFQPISHYERFKMQKE